MRKNFAIEPAVSGDFSGWLGERFGGSFLRESPVAGTAITFLETAPAPDAAAVEPMDAQTCVDWLACLEITGDSFGAPCRRGMPLSALKKWSSLVISVLLHCVLGFVLYAAAKPHLPPRVNWIEVQLVGSCGGGEGAGPAAHTTGGGDRSPHARKSDNTCPPMIQEPFSIPETDNKVTEEKPLRSAESAGVPPAVPVKERTHRRKTAKAGIHPMKEETAANSVAPDAAGEPAPVASGAAAEAEGERRGPGSSAGVGPAPSGSPGGSGKSGPHGGGPVEVAFGSPGGPRFLHKVIPVYPPFARKQEMQGAVLLRVTINEEGRVVEVEIVKKGGFGFDEAAVKAIRESTFIPAKRDGKSLSCKALLPIRFELKTSDVD